MSPERESRLATNETAKNLNNNHPHSIAQLVGSSVEQQLDTLLWQLFLGQIELHELTPALLAWHTLAYDQGRASRDTEFEQLKHRLDRIQYEADLWYFCHSNKKTPADYYRHQTTEQWQEASR